MKYEKLFQFILLQYVCTFAIIFIFQENFLHDGHLQEMQFVIYANSAVTMNQKNEVNL